MHSTYICILLASTLFQFVSAKAIPNPSPQVKVWTGTGTTQPICSEGKINGNVLNSFTPENPPSFEAVSSCDFLFNQTSSNDSSLSSQVGVTAEPMPRIDHLCYPYRSFTPRIVDIQVAMLHIQHLYPRVIEWKGQQCDSFSWGNAKITWCGTIFFNGEWINQMVMTKSVMLLAETIRGGCGYRRGFQEGGGIAKFLDFSMEWGKRDYYITITRN